jgi:hypothetical protein
MLLRQARQARSFDHHWLVLIRPPTPMSTRKPTFEDFVRAAGHEASVLVFRFDRTEVDDLDTSRVTHTFNIERVRRNGLLRALYGRVSFPVQRF